MLLTTFEVAHHHLALLKPLIDDYGVGEDETVEFPNNVLSKRTSVWASGALGKVGATPRFSVEEAELAGCRSIAAAAVAVAGDRAIGLGSEASDPFLPLFIAANTFEAVPASITPPLIRDRFAGTLFPAFTIAVEPMTASSGWWRQVRDCDGADAVRLAWWAALRSHFADHPGFTDAAFVSIGTDAESWSVEEADWPAGTIVAPCMFPRLMLGLTAGGSLAGLLGWCVYT